MGGIADVAALDWLDIGLAVAEMTDVGAQAFERKLTDLDMRPLEAEMGMRIVGTQLPSCPKRLGAQL